MSNLKGNNSTPKQKMWEIEDDPNSKLPAGELTTADERQSLKEQIFKTIAEETVSISNLRDRQAVGMLYNCIVTVENLINSSKWPGANLQKEALTQLVAILPLKQQDKFQEKSQTIENLKIFVSKLVSNSNTFRQAAITSKIIRQAIDASSDPEQSGWDIKVDKPDYKFSCRGSNWR